VTEQNQPTGPKRRAARRRADAAEPPAEASPAAPTENATSGAAPPRRFISLPGVEATSNTVRSLLINFSFFAAFFLLLPALATQLWKNQVVIEPISVPPALVEMGVTPEVAANRVWDGLKDFAAAADTAKRTFVAVPQGRALDFSIPQSGLSLDAALSQLRQFLNLFETRISGEFVCQSPACTPADMRLRLRVLRGTATIIDLPAMGPTASRDYFRLAAENIFAELDPFVSIAALSRTAPDRAVVLARQMVRRRDPEAHWAYNLIGEIEMNRGNHAEALAAFEAAHELDPRMIEAEVNRALALAHLGRFDEAGVVLQQAARSGSGRLEVAKAGASVAYMRGDRAAAVGRFLEAAGLEPEEPRHLVLAGRTELELGSREAGEAHLRDALAVAPGDPEALEALGNLYYGKYGDAPDYAAAAKMYRNWAQFAPQDANAWFSLGNALVATRSYADALAAYDTAIARGETSDRLMVVRAGTLMGLALAGDRPLADPITAFEALRDAEPPMPTVFLSLGKLYDRDNRPTEALAAFSRFLELAPADHEQRGFAETEVARLSPSTD
jgi:tetratricopeptide (TPR) repeat protein